MIKELRDLRDTMVAEQATGCKGAGGYLAFAKSQGYTRLEPLNTCSSAGDWQFLVSVDGQEWQVLWQENNWPRPGFTYGVDNQLWFGTLEEVYADIERFW